MRDLPGGRGEPVSQILKARQPVLPLPIFYSEVVELEFGLLFDFRRAGLGEATSLGTLADQRLRVYKEKRTGASIRRTG